MRRQTKSVLTLLLPLVISMVGLSQVVERQDVEHRGVFSSKNALIDPPAAIQQLKEQNKPKADVHVFHPRPVMIGDASRYSPPNFSGFKDTQAKKQAFYNYLLPKIHLANQEVMLERKWLTALVKNLDQGIYPTHEELSALDRIENRYAIKRKDMPTSKQAAQANGFDTTDKIRLRLACHATKGRYRSSIIGDSTGSKGVRLGYIPFRPSG